MAEKKQLILDPPLSLWMENCIEDIAQNYLMQNKKGKKKKINSLFVIFRDDWKLFVRVSTYKYSIKKK